VGAIRFELRCAVRALRRAPGYTAVLISAIAIAVTFATTLLSLVRATSWRPIPYPNPDQVVAILASSNVDCAERCPDLFAWDTYRAIEASQLGFSAVAPVLGATLPTELADSATVLSGAATTSAFFDLIGTPPAVGRSIQADDDVAGAPLVAVLSYGTWKRQFAGSTAVVGHQVRLSGRSHTIIGVMPAGFDHPSGTAVWTNLRVGDPEAGAMLAAVGRLAPGASMVSVRSRLDVLAGQLRPAADTSSDRRGLAIVSVTDQGKAASSEVGWFTGGVVGFILLLACLNTQVLALIRWIGRGREIGVRMALGAGRAQILRQAVIEQVALGLAAGLLASGLTAGSLAAVDRVMSTRFSLGAPLEFGLMGLTTAISFAVLLSVAIGLSPLLLTGKRDAATMLRRDPAVATPSRGQHRLRLILVASEIAAAVLLVSGAVVLLKSLFFVENVQLGFDPSVAVAQVWIDDQSRWDRRRVIELAERAASRARGADGIAAATVWSTMGPSMMVAPGEPFASIEGSRIETRPICSPYPRCPWPASFQGVDSAFFRVLGIPVIRGRTFGAADDVGTEPVAVVNRRAAEVWWPGADPLGKRFRIGPETSGHPWLTVVGVVENSHPASEAGLGWGARFHDRYFAAIYVPLRQMPIDAPGRPVWAANLLVGVRPLATGASLPAVRREIAAAAPDARVGPLESFRALLDKDWAIDRMRFRLRAVGLIATVSIALVALGLVAIVAYAVRARTREIGIRMALGAPAGSLVRLVAREALLLTGTGLLAGVGLLIVLRPVWAVLFLGANGRFPGFVFGTTLLDPVAVSFGLLGLTAIALVTSALPAVRATRVDPVQCLRAD